MVKSTRQASCPGREGWYPARLRVTPERDLPTPPDDFPVPSSHWGTPPSHLTAPSNHWGTPSSRLTAPSSHWGTPPNRLTAPSNHWGTPSNRLAGPSNHLPAPVWAGAFPSFLLIINQFRQNRRSTPPCRQANRLLGYKRPGNVLGKSQPSPDKPFRLARAGRPRLDGHLSVPQPKLICRRPESCHVRRYIPRWSFCRPCKG